MDTLVELLLEKKELKDKGIFFIDNNRNDEFCSFADLYNESLQILAQLNRIGVKCGDNLILQINQNKEFLYLFWACVLGGINAVPLTYSKSEEMFLKLKNVVNILDSCFVIGDQDIKDKLESDMVEYKKCIESFFILDFNKKYHVADDLVALNRDSEDIAFIQFSSGSTGSPKGVILTHKNLMVNLRAMLSATGMNNEQDIGVSWLPLTHDMGMIGAHLNAVFNGGNLALIDTMSFLFKPSVLFDIITEYRATLTAMPNFSLNYIINHYKMKSNKVQFDWDLSSLKFIMCGAEPISVLAVRNFENIFSKYHLKQGVILPVYGLAEASLAVAFTEANTKFIFKNFERNQLNIGNKIILSEATEDKSVPFVSVGKAVNNVEISIRDENEHVLEDGTVGLIYIRGESVTKGYINDEVKTRELFSKDMFLNTSDVGVFVEGNLYIIGRMKEMMILNGQNYYSSDLERVVLDSLGVETAFVSENLSESHKDNVHVFVCERKNLDPITAEEQVRSIIREQIGIHITAVHFVRNFPRTTSGKIQRFLLLDSIKQI
ncbi:MAG: AMP-binding protein [Oscillospiraceae bacterium]|nr:AMP-binding protein [Oscillospiraceae bacterium]